MLELATALLPALHAGERVAVITVTRVARSAPRGAGAAMALTESGRVIGSISGGCVEGDSVMLGAEALASGVGRTASFGFSDDVAHAAGLACGGAVDVVSSLIEPTDAATLAALELAAADRPVSVSLVTSGPAIGRLVAPEELAASTQSERALRLRETHMLTAAYDGDDVLLISVAPKPRLIILGAGEHAAALCRVAAASGWAVTVCDAWPLLITAERFPEATELVAEMPHEYLARLSDIDGDIDARTAVCVLTHDERLDVPALRVALDLPVGFVGALGARATVARRTTLLLQAGVDAASLARLHSPLGLDLGGSRPDEVAIAALAEIVAARYDASTRPLRVLDGPLHRRAQSANTEEACTIPQEA
ncbi:xanthine dehydrogenase accessory factor [Microbacterium endophyticum]|uniref:Xanthine dehydrogenase accessory factor n=1 Tax=Microbacterium endophyticum TaxID=1526412 RepID=A0A7W4V6K4_9MICO|nr:XdhC family protein [Microbacterium endophyticum]MBB2977165.1 xanthine dehydrogenase accessory factor [Microbacterium endophyticum]NIK36093.1 xanthine dehydrogenase accessory factor [Microbacterium endophyticum]